MYQRALFDAMAGQQIVNVASVPKRSPFRYPGGKTWLVPWIRQWLGHKSGADLRLVEPFAGGAIVGLTAVFENLVARVTLVELDPDVASVWQTILNGHAEWLAERIATFNVSHETVQLAIAESDKSQPHRAFATILRNRVNRGGILAPGASFVKHGENGKGLLSRWYPATLCTRIRAIAQFRDRIEILERDGIEVLQDYRDAPNTVFFIDPPYTVAGRRLYALFDINHDNLFRVASQLKGDFVMTYDDTEEVRDLAKTYHLETRDILMKNTHHAKKVELLIGRQFEWFL